jgi:uncharacterized protein YbaP (TraB family)
MKRLQIRLVIFLVISLMLSLTACPSSPTVNTSAPTSESTQPSTEPVVQGPVDIYNAAKAALDTAAALELTVVSNKVKTFNNERYEQNITQSITLCGQGTDHFEAFVKETVSQGQTSFTSTEYYDGTTVYMDFESALYRSDMNVEEYLTRLLPAALLDSSLYGQIEQEGSTLIFSEPTAGENWAMYETALLNSAAGTAVVDSNGALTSTSYNASFRYGAVGMELSVSADITVPKTTELSQKAPTEPDTYTKLKYIDAPKVTELAIATVNGTNHFTGQITRSFSNSANSMELINTDVVSTWGSIDDLMAKSHYTVEMSTSNTEPVYDELITTFRDGVCSNGTSSAAEMKNHCSQTLTKLIPSGIDLLKADITDAGSLYLLELKGSKDFGQDIIRTECVTYAQSAKIPTENYTKRTLNITLSLDKYTGFPVYLTMEYSGQNKDTDKRIILYYDAQISFDLGSNDAYTQITGEDLPDSEPENKATPLFYHVTSAKGEEMWLLGTIHIGDSRTAFLPQELCDAFNNSDALAVEVDILEFEEQMMTDTDLQMQLAQNWLYTNGSTLRKHVSKEVYEAAITVSKAMGFYDETLVYFKAGLLESYISDYYRRHIPEFVSEKGVDYRLLTAAKEQGKPVISIENGFDQMTMFTTCSDELQEALLGSAIATDAAQYHDGSVEMFEAWCAGDETRMREIIITDISELPEEERPIYEEYTKIMENDRNALMLEKAIEYLQSGDVIFYAVGAAHVLAEDGLLNTLRDAGYTVEQVAYANS